MFSSGAIYRSHVRPPDTNVTEPCLPALRPQCGCVCVFLSQSECEGGCLNSEMRKYKAKMQLQHACLYVLCGSVPLLLSGVGVVKKR